MEFQRSEYPGMLSSLQPSQAVALLSDRMKHVSKTNSDIADWLQERRRLEEHYVQGLRRLARKQPPDEDSELGVFTSPWEKIVFAAEALAESHNNLARRIETDIERPLREFHTHSRELQQMSTIQGNLAALAKEYDAAHARAGKLKERSGKGARKAENLEQDVDSATGQWESQAPYVFEQLQAVDESRFNHLRDVLTQFQTHEVDQVERSRRTAEQVLNVLLNINTADEVKAFSLRNTGSAGAPTGRARRRESRAMPSMNSLAPPTTAPRPRTPVRDGSIIDSSPMHEEKKSRFSGIKRLGTVLNRRKSTVPSLPRPSPSKSRSAARLGSETDLTEGLHQTRTSATTDRIRDQAFAPLPPVPKISDAAGRPSSSDQGSINADRGDHSSPIHPVMNGVSRTKNLPPHQSQFQPSHPPSQSQPTQSTSQYQPPQPTLQYQQTTQQTQPTVVTSPPVETPAQMDRDHYGFNSPPQSNDPISQAQAEAAGFSDQSPSQFKLDIKNAPISEEGSDAQTAMASVASTLRQQAPPTRRTATQRGRRDVRNTIFVPSTSSTSITTQPEVPPQPHGTPQQNPRTSSLPQSQQSASSMPSLSYPPSSHRPFSSEDHASDTQSIRSAHSLLASPSAVGAGAVKHPELHGTGLNSSIIETVNATLEHGTIIRASVLGELALSHNNSTSSLAPTASQKETVRLDNFPTLEKVAPNPAFVQQHSQDHPGEYTLSTSLIAGSKPQVAFKYQLHLDENTLARHVPLLLSPTWKVEAAQTSVILNYSWNPTFAAAAPEGVTLHNVVLILYLGEGAGRALSCQSRPTGTFSKSSGCIYWKMDEVKLVAGKAEKVLARFATEGEGSAGRVEAKFEVHDEGAGSALGVSRLDEGASAGGASPGAASDPFTDAGAAATGLGNNSAGSGKGVGSWKEVPVVRRLVAGSYVGT